MPRPLNLCSACGEDFYSVGLFDKHRVGKHAYTYAEGVQMDPPREDGRRCLDTEEMAALGWSTDMHGRWRGPAPAGKSRHWATGRV